MIGASALIYPTAKGEGWSPDEAFVESLKAAYPAVDVQEELLRAWIWCQASPKQRKTIRGMPRFLNGWISRCQESLRAAEIQRVAGRYYQPQRRVFNS